MGDTLGILMTFTTNGTWLRGNARGWVDDGVIMPPDPVLEAADAARLKHTPYRFDAARLLDIGDAIGESLIQRERQIILALTVQTWHVHLVVAATMVTVEQIVKCAKDAGRYYLRVGRPIWTEGYDKRFCFTHDSLLSRIDYVERHNERSGWPCRPWTWLAPCPA